MGNWCPQIKMPCKDDCVYFRRGTRYFEDPQKKPVPFEECAFNIMADCMEQMVSRSIGQQQAMEQTRNEVSELHKFFQSAMRLSMVDQGKLKQ